MALKLRMARGGRRNLPYYRIVATDSRNPRDGKFLEKVGTYNPLLANDNPQRVTLNVERIKYWLEQGAQPSDRVALFLGKAGLIEMPKYGETPKKSAPKAKTVERNREKAEKAEKAAADAEAAKQAAAEAAAAPAPVEEPAAVEEPVAEAAPEVAAEPAAEEPKAE
ncbi:MAG: 30S ribosomal protein S16 [Micavibrio sp.]